MEGRVDLIKRKRKALGGPVSKKDSATTLRLKSSWDLLTAAAVALAKFDACDKGRQIAALDMLYMVGATMEQAILLPLNEKE